MLLLLRMGHVFGKNIDLKFVKTISEAVRRWVKEASWLYLLA
jgi:hypothetical protein